MSATKVDAMDDAVAACLPHLADVVRSTKAGARVKLKHAAYVRSWFSVLKTDKRAIFTAAAKAQAAADFLLPERDVPAAQNAERESYVN